jgi:hypothetical protein
MSKLQALQKISHRAVQTSGDYLERDDSYFAFAALDV